MVVTMMMMMAVAVVEAGTEVYPWLVDAARIAEEDGARERACRERERHM